MLVLGIESSCDDTSVALLNCSDQGHVVIAEKTASQIDIHQKYGGVVPEVAGRMHAEKIVPLIEAVLSEGTRKKEQGPIKPDVIAVTAGPGLITGLLVGVEAARTLSYAWNIPLVATNHISGHIHSVEISNFQFPISNQSPITNNQLANQLITFPALALVVSGGHTELVLMKSHTEREILGRTKDDAAGECFDKVAKLLELPYPGGPKISKLAENGRIDAIDFPRPMLREKNYEFSFAGLKTSALYWLRSHSLAAVQLPQLNVATGVYAQSTPEPTINDFCASFEQAITDVLVGKTMRAVEEYKPRTVILGGGVAANKKIRETLREEMGHVTEKGVQQYAPTLLVPPLPYCMDNGAMIAVAGYYEALAGHFTPWSELDVDPQWRVDRGQTILA